MKREGRQHGMVRTYRILPASFNPRSDETRYVNKFDSMPTAGLFAKVSSKRTNHSKFTGKCGTAQCTACHILPVCKAKNKTKGAQKMKSHDVVSNGRLLSWRVADGGPGFKYSGVSASGMLAHLSNCYRDDDFDYDYEDQNGDHDVLDDLYDHDGPYYDDDDHPTVDYESLIEKRNYEIDYDDHNGGQEDHNCDEDDDDRMSFCDVGFVMDQVEVEEEGCEGWCLVGEK